MDTSIDINERKRNNHLAFKIHDYPLSQDVWDLKYRRNDEKSISDTITRVVDGVIGLDPKDAPLNEALYNLMLDGVFLPGGRILAGAGLPEHDSTLMNCYVMGVLDDSLTGIMDCLRESAFTAKFGGGIGIDFSPLRPKGSPIKTAAYFAGGPVAFMALWDAMGHAMEAGGNRRGGKMGVLRVDHPDIMEFIEAKTKYGKLTGFNISVGITDAFMVAVKTDERWNLVHGASPNSLQLGRDPTSGKYVYASVMARDLWNKILETTYEHSEPGILFIDRINQLNPLNYRETIYATNPCGEQPLPPYGACNLGSINLARCVMDPFTGDSEIDYDQIAEATRLAIRFLDKVLDVTKYPLERQELESGRVRRIGLGITGLADLLAQREIPYDSRQATHTASHIMSLIANTAYLESSRIAKERGHSFPHYDPVKHQEGIFFQRLDAGIQAHIELYGLAHGLLLSIAPTGTISTVFGDVSSGCEPHFSHRTRRKIKVKDHESNDIWAEYWAYSYSVRLFAWVKGIEYDEAYDHFMANPEIFQTAQTIPVEAHVNMVAALQCWVDSAISKTTNCPTEMSFEEFKDVYQQAYNLGLKGCTTYRPSDTRDAVLISGDTPAQPRASENQSDAQSSHEEEKVFPSTKAEYKRGYALSGKTYKLVWPDLPSPVFVTINHDEDGHPIEVFIASKNAIHNEWTVALSVLCSKLLQTGYPLVKVAEQLKQINLSTSTSYDNGRHYGSLVSRIGYLLEEHVATETLVLKVVIDNAQEMMSKAVEDIVNQVTGVKCGFCGSKNLRKEEGCIKCDDCSQSKCD